MKEYLKAQVKIMLVICLVCVAGLWILKIPGFLGWGLTVGLLDALPVLGTGLFFIPAGILFLIQGKNIVGIGFFGTVFHHSSGQTVYGAKTCGESYRSISTSGTVFCLSWLDFLWRCRICLGPALCTASLWDFCTAGALDR